MFLPDSNNCFFICLVPYTHICFYFFLILFFYFHLLFLTLLAKRYILHFTMFDSISLQSVKSINYKQTKSPNITIFGTKYEFFLPPYQLTTFLIFAQVKSFFSYHILMNILSMNYCVITIL